MLPNLDSQSQVAVPGQEEADEVARIISEIEDASATGQDRQMLANRYDLHDYLRNWMAKSMMFRKESYESKWDRWRRNSRNIYDPALKARKEKWQNTMFVPITMQNKEIIKSNLYRTLVNELPYSVKNRPSGNVDEAMALRTLILRELELSDFEIAANDVFDDTITYGTGFLKMYWDQQYSMRVRREPVYEQATDQRLAEMQLTGRPLQIVGYQKLPPSKVIIHDGIVTFHVPIWDMFFEDMAKSVQSGPHAQRYKLSIQDIIDGVKDGYFFPEAYTKLKDLEDDHLPPDDKLSEVGDLGLTISTTPKTKNAERHTVYEWWGKLPQKWVFVRPEDQHLITDPEGLIPAKALFADQVLLAVDPNDDYCGESPFMSVGYLRTAGSVYHIGVGEMLEQLQESINEDTNQRKDNVQLILNKMYVILERAIVSKSDLVSRPGGFVRIKSNSSDDVGKAFAAIETPDVTRSSYEETINVERFGQELTGANRALIGSGGGMMSRDITQTKGGLQLIKQSSNDRLAYYAMVIESDFLKRVIRKAYTLIYNHIDQNKIQKVLGPRLSAAFQLYPPEEVVNDYAFEPEGVFSSMNQPIRVSQWQAFRDQYKGAPFFNDIEAALILGKAIEMPELDKVIVPPTDPVTGQTIPFEMMQRLSMAGQMMSGQFMPPEGPGKAGEKGTTPRIPSKKPGKNAEQAE